MSQDYKRGADGILYQKLLPLDHPHAKYEGFLPETTLLPAGYTDYEGALPFPCDTIYQRDVGVTLRDGTVIYADIYRPAGKEPVPALYSVSWAGKSGRHDMWESSYPEGRSQLSGRQLWLGLDPARWVQHGYAVVSVDSRGVYASHGDMRFPCRQEGLDGYDTVEWIAEQPWCNGRVAAVGQRWTGEMHWFTAAQQPPHLVCIAPWDAHGNLYYEEFMRGGIPKAFGTTLERSFGNGYLEAIDQMMKEEPFLNCTYWQDRIVDFQAVKIPAYLVGNYNSQYHTGGNLTAWEELGSTQKWLRLFQFEGFKYPYDQDYLDDLRRFLDFFVKGVDNGWDQTPKVRLTILDPGGTDIVDRPEDSFPPSGTVWKQLWLDADRLCWSENSPAPGQAQYQSEQDGGLSLVYPFPENGEVDGCIKLKLWVSSPDSDDMDLFITVDKVDQQGNQIPHSGYSSVAGKLRVSHRELDPARSTWQRPWLLHHRELRLAPGEIVPIELSLWPVALRFRAGEYLRIRVAGQGDVGIPFVYEPGWIAPESRNRGIHVIHSGGSYDSHILLPILSERREISDVERSNAP